MSLPGPGVPESDKLIVSVVTWQHDVAPEVKRVLDGDPSLAIPDRSLGTEGFSCEFRDWLSSTHQQLELSANALFKCICWRYGIRGAPRELRSPPSSMRWDSDDEARDAFQDTGFLSHQVPYGLTLFRLPSMQSASWDEDNGAAVEEMLTAGAAQPVQFALLNEAERNAASNPRSALVIAIAAAETAIKSTASEVCYSDALSWLLEKAPSPPLVSMLGDFLELLPCRSSPSGKMRRPPKALLKTLERGVQARNKIVHGRSESVAPQELVDLLLATRDLLYLLDYYRGHEWAKQRLSPEVREELQSH